MILGTLKPMFKETISFVVVRKMNIHDIEIYLSKLSKYEQYTERIQNVLKTRC